MNTISVCFSTASSKTLTEKASPATTGLIVLASRKVYESMRPRNCRFTSCPLEWWNLDTLRPTASKNCLSTSPPEVHIYRSSYASPWTSLVLQTCGVGARTFLLNHRAIFAEDSRVVFLHLISQTLPGEAAAVINQQGIVRFAHHQRNVWGGDWKLGRILPFFKTHLLPSYRRVCRTKTYLFLHHCRRVDQNGGIDIAAVFWCRSSVKVKQLNTGLINTAQNITGTVTVRVIVFEGAGKVIRVHPFSAGFQQPQPNSEAVL